MLHPHVFRKTNTQNRREPTAGQWVAVYHQQSDVQQRDADGRRSFAPTQTKNRACLHSESTIHVRNSLFACTHGGGSGRMRRFGTESWKTARLSQTRCFAIGLVHRRLSSHARRGRRSAWLVVDRYGDCLSAEVFIFRNVPKMHSDSGTHRCPTRYQTWLIQECPQFQSQEGQLLQPKRAKDSPMPLRSPENGVSIESTMVPVHKTAFFVINAITEKCWPSSPLANRFSTLLLHRGVLRPSC